MTDRFVDNGLKLCYFSSEDIWVFCPKCNEIAHVYPQQEFSCSHCLFHSQVVASNSCKNCKKPLHHGPRCRRCGTINNVKETNEILTKRYDMESGNDPYYGFKLVLQKDIGFKTLWFYNPDHLTYIESFLKAKIIEKSTKAGNNSIISRLPAWVKSSKTRDTLLKAIQKIKIKYGL
jgi:hypothetical protein